MRLSRRRFLGLALAAPGLLRMNTKARAADPAAGLVSMDMVVSEMLLTLGIVPLATANIPLYRRLVSDPPMPGTVADLGPLTEPNLEYLRLLAPSRILMADWQAAGLETLTRIAPLEPLPLFPGKTPALDHTETILRRLGALCQRQDVAESVIAATRDTIDSARATLACFDRPVFLCRFNRDGRNLAVFGGNGMLGDVVRRLGLRNGYEGRVNAASGGASLPLTRLAGNPQAVIVHFDRGAETEAALARLAENPIWQALPAVRQNRVVRIPVIYPTGAMRSASRFARELATHLPGLSNG